MMWKRRFFALSLSLFLLAAFWSFDASAQACCTATGAGEFGVVGRCHQSVLAAQLGYEPILGTYDSRRNFNTFEGANLQDLLVTIGGGTRFGTERFQLHGSLPLRLQYRQFSGLEGATGWGVGDATLGARWLFLQDMMSGIFPGIRDTYYPFLEGYLNLRIPSGRSPEAANDPIGADVTGTGHWGAVAGLKVVKFLTYQHVLGAYVDGAYTLGRSIDRGRGSVDYRPGVEVSSGLTYQHIPTLRWSWGVMGGVRFQGRAVQDGEALLESSTQRLLFGAHVTRSIVYPFWEVSLSASNDAWGDLGGKNLPFVGPNVALVVQRNFL